MASRAEEAAKKIARRARARFAPERQPPVLGLVLKIERFMYFQGRIYVAGEVSHPEYKIDSLAYRSPGGRAVRVKGPAGDGDFAFEVRESDPSRATGLQLLVGLEPGYVLTEPLVDRFVSEDPYHRLINDYFGSLRGVGNPRVLEIGSRNRSGVVRRDWVGPDATYVGLDVLPGENVDVVGDVHELGSLFPPASFDSVFSMSTFEHLAMPWKVAIELNHVLATGGTVMTATHQTWPLHDQPWDFWRFSENSWSAIFNEYTGFEVERVALGEPASIVAHNVHPTVVLHPICAAMMGSAAICRKVGPPKVTWDIPLSEIVKSVYPA